MISVNDKKPRITIGHFGIGYTKVDHYSDLVHYCYIMLISVFFFNRKIINTTK
jgi:hypothetical protein